jgi:hemolysin activation/secretion protein
LQGILGGTQVVGDSLRNKDVIQGLFAPLLNKVVRRDEVESQLMRVQHLLPGVTAQGSFSRGERLGQSIATITVAEFAPFHGSIYLDNYGNQSTGEFRLGARFVFNNPTGFEDRLTVDLVANETPDGFDDPQNPIEKDDFQCCFGGFQYEMFSDSLLYSYGFAWSRTQYDIGNNADFQLARLGFSGESNTTRLFFNYHQTLTPTYSQTWSLNWTFSEADLMARNDFIGADVLLNRDQVPEYDLGYSFTKHHETNVYYGQIGAFFGTDPDSSFPIPTDVFGYDDSPVNVFGQAVGPSRVGSNDNSFRVKADLFAQLNSVSEAVQFKARMAMQKSSDILSPIQQFSLAGPYAVRAYPSGSFLADSGLLLSLDATYALSHSADLTVFYDVAYGELNDIDPAAEFDATIQGLGLGLQYRHSNDWEVKLTAATALGISDGVNGEPRPNIRNGGEEVTGRKDTQVFASFLYNF